MRMDLSGWRCVGELYKMLYGSMKDVEFVGSSDDDLRAFPQVARQRAGYQLHLVQSGRDPSDWKSMRTVGPGCREVRIRDAGDAYRVFYVASIGDTVFVLHCFQKKSKSGIATPKEDMNTIRARLKIAEALAKELRNVKAHH